MKIDVPPDIEGPLAEEARRQGTTPELLAVDALRARFGPDVPPANGATLADFLADHIGVLGTGNEQSVSVRM